MNDNDHSEILSDENSEDATGALIVTLTTEISDDSETHFSNNAPPSIETLTAEIKMYLLFANLNIIEVGKRLIQAKEILPHGEWLNWLKENFNLKERMAQRFMMIAELLALPESTEQNFLALKSAEGNPAKYKDDNQISLFASTESNRHLPQFHPEKWLAFKEYFKQDVVSERAILNLLIKFAPTDFEQRLWCLDQKINSNGVLIDLQLVDGAIKIYNSLQAAATSQNQVLTDGINLNSNPQLLNWFEQQEGWRPDNLNKTSRDALKADNLKPIVRTVLELKEILSKTSVKKYQAMINSACNDGRARGMFQFYGANRTGRWAGRLIQLQNLPQNHLVDLDVARQFVKNGDSVALKISFDKPADVLSQLIRTAFIAPKGSRFIVADFSAIEARVITWLADEKWRLQVFADGGDIYCASASAMFKVPVEKHGVNKDLRAKGKIAELACGFGGNVASLKAFGSDKLGLSDSDMAAIITKWLASNPNICKLWHDIESAAITSVKFKSSTVSYKGIRFETVDVFFTENIVQAIARDCLAIAMTHLDDAGYKIVMHIHDEMICEMTEGIRSLDEVLQIICQPIY